MKTDIQIAQEAKLEHIRDVAARIGISEDDLEFYGKYKAKLSDDLWDKIKDMDDGKLVPFSYTHLDVYKRQIIPNPTLNSAMR